MGCGASATPPPAKETSSDKTVVQSEDQAAAVKTEEEPKPEPKQETKEEPKEEPKEETAPVAEAPGIVAPGKEEPPLLAEAPAKAPAEAEQVKEEPAPKLTPISSILAEVLCSAPNPDADTSITQGPSVRSVAPKEELPALLEKIPFLNREHHFLREHVERCQQHLAEDDHDNAQEALERLSMELALEEQIIGAAFARFDHQADHLLQSKEIEFMLDYLGFPCSPEDVTKFIDVLDKNDDDKISFAEFVDGVGRMGGSAKLFELRRLQIEKRTDFEDAQHSTDALRLQLAACGIQPHAQLCWQHTASGTELDAAAHLQPCQKAALRHIRALAQVSHERALPGLLERVSKLGYGHDDLLMCLAWIRELSPIIVHINLDKIGTFLKRDTHYRNQFEVKASSGLLNLEVRTKWEKKLFGDSYDNVEPSDRPRYGVLNVWNDYRGVMGCKQYGDSYLVLKDVRLRCTLSPQDSGNLKGSSLAVLDYYAHVLAEYTDKELKEALRVAEGGAERLGDSQAVIAKWGKYKEAQIHGELSLDKHVSRLVVAERHREQSSWIQEIVDAHGWTLTWKNDMRDELHARSEGVEMSQTEWEETLETMEKSHTDLGEPQAEAECENAELGEPPAEGEGENAA